MSGDDFVTKKFFFALSIIIVFVYFMHLFRCCSFESRDYIMGTW